MRFTPDNFLRLLKDIVPGSNQAVNKVAGGLLPGQSSGLTSNVKGADGGFKLETVLPLSSVYNLGSTTALSTINNVQALVANELNAGSSTSTAQTTIGNVSFPITRDYDENSDELVLRIIANVSTGVNTNVVLTGSLFVLPLGSSTPSTGPVVNFKRPFNTAASTGVLSSTATVFEAGFTGNGMKRDNVVGIKIGTNGGNSTATDSVVIWAIEEMDSSCLVSFHETDNTGNATGTLDGFGNPLR